MFKGTKFVVYGKHSEPNVYDIEPVDCRDQVHTINQYQLCGLKIISEDELSNDHYASKRRL